MLEKVSTWLKRGPIGRIMGRIGSNRKYNKSRNSLPVANGTQILSRRIRLMFIGVAFPFLTLATICLIITLIEHNVDQSAPVTLTVYVKFRQFLYQHRPIVIFLSVTFALMQLIAIAAALFNWSVILFAYVVITGIFGTIVGIVGIFGILFSCLFMKHQTQNDHSIAITITVLIVFLVIFYLFTILGIKLMEHLRRN